MKHLTGRVVRALIIYGPGSLVLVGLFALLDHLGHGDAWPLITVAWIGGTLAGRWTTEVQEQWP